MLSLDDPRWETLYSCYGEKSVPGLLQQLMVASLPLSREPRPTLWDDLLSELEHQATLYPVTIAAMPYLVRLAARVEPAERAEWLSEIAGMEAVRTLGIVYDPQGQITPDLITAYEQSLRDVVPLVQETLAAGPKWGSGRPEANMATLLSLLAFAYGERRLGLLLARWWPYAETSSEQEPLPLASLKQYEELTGDIRGPFS